MADEFENMNLTTNSFHISHIHNLFLLKDLNGNFLTCEHMNAEFNFAKGTLA